MTRSTILAGVAIMLAACSPPAASTRANANQSGGASTPTATAAGVGGILPGQYRTTVTILAMSIPGVSASQIQAMQAQPMSDEDCVTTSDINELAKKSLIDADEGESCSDNHMNAANGHIEGAATCTSADGDTHNMQVTGSYTSTHVEMDVTMTGQNAHGPISEHIRMATDRIGECPAH